MISGKASSRTGRRRSGISEPSLQARARAKGKQVRTLPVRLHLGRHADLVVVKVDEFQARRLLVVADVQEFVEEHVDLGVGALDGQPWDTRKGSSQIRTSSVLTSTHTGCFRRCLTAAASRGPRFFVHDSRVRTWYWSYVQSNPCMRRTFFIVP